MFVVTERFLLGIVNEYGEHPISTDGDGTWYSSQACRFLKLNHHHPHSNFERSIIERTIQHKE
jgi:putative transposase